MSSQGILRAVSRLALAAGLLSGGASVARAQTEAERIVMPILEARLRYDGVDQLAVDADAITLRVRAGGQARLGRFSLLAEGEATVAPLADYNAYPFTAPDERQWRPGFAVVADPENVELNRLQLQYASGPTTLTLGRQRINIDDQRWVGSVGWRQNEQTFDAVRAESRIGPVGVDVAYAIGQRTVFGNDAGPRTSYGGDFVMAGLSVRHGAVQGRLLAYLLDYDEPFFLANSSQTYGGWLSAAIPLGGETRLNLRASYARQADYGRNPSDYAANYWSLEAGSTLAGFTIAAGWEELGSDNGRAVQTPMATLHKFNGWADMFLTTPPAGLEDFHVTVGRRFDGVKALPGLNFALAYHRFESAAGGMHYGDEWNASVGFRVGPTSLLLKLADYDAAGFGADTRKVWLQLEWALN